MQAVTTVKARQQRGFTLIELSIVLVIIGLIVGGILTGQDLIKAAQVRSEITQLERYNTAANTFRGKYNGIPGDMLSGVTYFSAITNQNSGTVGLGNGDGLVEGTTGAAGCSNCLAGENLIFWYELNQAGYIGDPTVAYTNYTNVAPTISSQNVPNGKASGQVSVNAAGGLNYWILASFSGAAPEAAGEPASFGPAFAPIMAYQFDSKVDDGLPGTGTVISITTGTPGTVAESGGGAATYCCAGGVCTGGTNYNTTSTQVTGATCQLSVRTNF